jgi:hypothetical protein
MCATPALFHFFTPAQVIKLIIMALFAQTNNDNRPSRGKELVLLCMDYRYYDYDDATDTAKVKFWGKWCGLDAPTARVRQLTNTPLTSPSSVDSPILATILLYVLAPTII